MLIERMNQYAYCDGVCVHRFAESIYRNPRLFARLCTDAFVTILRGIRRQPVPYRLVDCEIVFAQAMSNGTFIGTTDKQLSQLSRRPR
jgi:hypothetical protein